MSSPGDEAGANAASSPDVEAGDVPFRTPNGDSDLLDNTKSASASDAAASAAQEYQEEGDEQQQQDEELPPPEAAGGGGGELSPSMAKIAAIVDQVRNKRHSMPGQQAIDVATLARGEVDKYYDYNKEEEEDYNNSSSIMGGMEEEAEDSMNASSTSVTLANRATSIISSYSDYIKDAVGGSIVGSSEPYIVGHQEGDHDTFDGDFVANNNDDNLENPQNIRSYGQDILQRAENATSSSSPRRPHLPPGSPNSNNNTNMMPGSPPPMGIWNNHTITNIDGDVITKGGKIQHRLRTGINTMSQIRPPKGILKNAKYATNKVVKRLSAGGGGNRNRRASDDAVFSDDPSDLHTFDEVCEELGVSRATHPELYDHRDSNNGNGKRKYTYLKSQLASPRCKRIMMYASIISVLIVVIAVAVSVVEEGVEHVHNRNSKFHPDWDEFDEKLKEKHANDMEWVDPLEEDKQGGGKESFDPDWDELEEKVKKDKDKPSTSMTEEEELDYNLEDEFFPIWFDRSTGWRGTTYAEAITFCASKDDFVPCPYEVYCPEGSQGDLIEGAMETGDSWSPVFNGDNDWVQVGTEGTCVTYQTMHNRHPDWGVTGGNEAITRHIMCCRSLPLVDGDGDNQEEEEEEDYDEAMTTNEVKVQDAYHPTWYSVDDGWDGSTFDAAINFCESIPHKSNGGTLHLCPLEAYCPNGSLLKHPLYLKQDPFSGEQWAPYASEGGTNNWAMVGDARQTCKGLSKPTWGDDGTRQELKQHILCCEKSFASDVAVTDPNTVPKADTADVSNTSDMTANELKVLNTYNPNWYDVKDGWDGSTFEAANEFCNSISHESNDGFISTLSLCPLEAYCPDGVTEQLYLKMDPFPGEQWAPYASESGSNNWVMVGDSMGHVVGLTCQPYNAVMGGNPPWGLDGNMPQWKKFILCCNKSFGTEDMIAAPQPGIPDVSNVGMMSSEAYQALLDKSQPVKFLGRTGGWQGSDYQQAEGFCKWKGGTLCNYEVICPNGAGEIPGGRWSDGEQWVAVLDGATDNEWVQVGSEGECNRYSMVYGKTPEWGLTGQGSEDKTSHIICCGIGDGDSSTAADTTSGSSSATESAGMTSENLYQAMLEDFRPVKFMNREQGWEGKTYQEAVDFCTSKGNGMLCPYEVFCPDGPGELREGEWGGGDQWVAIIDSPNDWVQVGTDQCARYSETYWERPSWGLTGEGSEQKTMHIMCCRMGVDNGQQASADTGVTTTTTTAADSNAASADESSLMKEELTVVDGKVLTDLEKRAYGKYNPQWFDREGGWTGGSYDDATSFCHSKSMDLCPLAAYCPNGPYYDGPPLFLQKEAYSGEQWAPFVGDNTWVLISDLYLGGQNSQVCSSYFELFHAEPSWGNDASNPNSKEHILCCDYKQESSKDEPNYDEIYLSVWKDFYPVTFDRTTGWVGRTYKDAIEFCDSHDEYIPCPYEAYCPAGRGKLLEGVLSETEAWSPIIDLANDWVQVGRDGECDRYSEVNGKGPDWGISGVGNGGITEHIMCCQKKSVNTQEIIDEVAAIESDGLGSPVDAIDSETTPMLTIAEEAIQEQYDPKWYTTMDGWNGGTYDDATDFCDSKSQDLCPFHAYCPNSPDDDKPLYLQKEGFKGEQWAPTSSAYDSWVHVGKILDEMPLTCRTYFELNHRLADFGSDGTMRTVKQNIMCCKAGSSPSPSKMDKGDGASDSDTETTSDVGAEEDSSPGFGMPDETNDITSTESTENTHTGAGNSSPHAGHMSAEEGMMATLHPKWYDSNTGWNGGSHQDAAHFCHSQIFDTNTNKTMVLCPYAVYCPNGPSNKPISINHDGIDFVSEGEQWAPVYGGFGEEHWVMIGMRGTNKVTQCLSYSQIHNGEEPEWGTNDSRQDIKKHVMCCAVQDRRRRATSLVAEKTS